MMAAIGEGLESMSANRNRVPKWQSVSARHGTSSSREAVKETNGMENGSPACRM